MGDIASVDMKGTVRLSKKKKKPILYFNIICNTIVFVLMQIGVNL